MFWIFLPLNLSFAYKAILKYFFVRIQKTIFIYLTDFT